MLARRLPIGEKIINGGPWRRISHVVLTKASAHCDSVSVDPNFNNYKAVHYNNKLRDKPIRPNKSAIDEIDSITLKVYHSVVLEL